ncbi:MAG: hypothetical protein LBP52_03135, partial [Burkholderiaceae bacterium]|nr:hypothetical protein [Burkholderiaceae bacterium]
MAVKETMIFMGISVLVLFIFEAITRIINIIFKNRGFHVPAFCMAMFFLGACGLFFNHYISGSDFNLNRFQMIVVDLPWIIWFFPLMLYTTSLIITSRYLKTISVFSY